MKRRTVLLAPLVVPLADASAAAPPEVARELPGAKALGTGRMSWFGLHVYDAHLWVLDGFDPARFEATPAALGIDYARALVGRKIAERSLEEMRRQGPIAPERADAWLAEMTRLFPDVGKGDRLVGLHKPDEFMRFLHNGRPTGELRDADFAKRFLGIWLAPQTSQPDLRRALLGEANRKA